MLHLIVLGFADNPRCDGICLPHPCSVGTLRVAA